MGTQVPTIGRIVHYCLNGQEADQINRKRVDAGFHAHTHDIVGSQMHTGNQAKEGDVYPMIIVRTWGNLPDSAVNGQVFLDGNDTLWVTSAMEGIGPRTYSWPTRV